jgi:hypothetical protein
MTEVLRNFPILGLTDNFMKAWHLGPMSFKSKLWLDFGDNQREQKERVVIRSRG